MTGPALIWQSAVDAASALLTDHKAFAALLFEPRLDGNANAACFQARARTGGGV
jgi:hypothetical protein